LLSRYTFALSCKNRFVFMQDDDFVYNESTMQKMYDFQEPITGCHKRWFYDGEYTKRPPKKGLKVAPIILTGGTLVDSCLLPDVIKYSKIFWQEHEYQKVFNGEDIFLSRAISKITNQDEFFFSKDSFTHLPTHDVQLHNKINQGNSRTEICNKIYNFFDDFS